MKMKRCIALLLLCVLMMGMASSALAYSSFQNDFGLNEIQQKINSGYTIKKIEYKSISMIRVRTFTVTDYASISKLWRALRKIEYDGKGFSPTDAYSHLTITLGTGKQYDIPFNARCVEYNRVTYALKNADEFWQVVEQLLYKYGQ